MRISFMFYVLCQILFRVLAMTMAATVASLTGNLPLFGGFAGTFLIQVAISSPRRAAGGGGDEGSQRQGAVEGGLRAEEARAHQDPDGLHRHHRPAAAARPEPRLAFVRHAVKHVSRVKKVKPGT